MNEAIIALKQDLTLRCPALTLKGVKCSIVKDEYDWLDVIHIRFTGCVFETKAISVWVSDGCVYLDGRDASMMRYGAHVRLGGRNTNTIKYDLADPSSLDHLAIDVNANILIIQNDLIMSSLRSTDPVTYLKYCETRGEFVAKLLRDAYVKYGYSARLI